MYEKTYFYQAFSKKMLLLSILTGLFISITMPITYFVLNWSEQEEVATQYSQEISNEISKAIKTNPELWQFAVIKFTQILNEADHHIVHIKVFDSEGRMINDESSPRSYMLTRTGTSDIVYNNIRFGHVEVTHIIDNTLKWTVLLFLFFSVLGLMIGLALFRLPARIIKTAEKDINNSIKQLNQNLQDVTVKKDEIAYLYTELASSEEKVNKRLVNTLRKCDTVARIGGDEFIILIENVEDLNNINRISEKILKRFNEPYLLNHQDCFIHTSIGIAMYPTDGMNADELIIKALHAFRKMGIHIAIDDFGEEYSSLKYLKQLPVDRIKIPMTFIQGIDVSNTDEAITKAIIVLAKSMGLDVIAEGVETKNQLDFLSQQMCNDIQGFYYHKPMPAHEVEELLKKMI